MEAGGKKYWVKFVNPVLALFFLGMIMVIIGYILENQPLIILGVLTIFMSFFVIAIPYFTKEMAKRNR